MICILTGENSSRHTLIVLTVNSLPCLIRYIYCYQQLCCGNSHSRSQQ